MELDVADLGTILGVWAHPDDEAYLMAGLMALAVAGGQRVACITATLGDAGETADEQRWPRERLLDIRRAELAASLRILGVDEHESLDLDDGTLASLDPTQPTARIAATIERVRPDTIITFGPDGMTGHPDHQAVSAWVDAALRDHARPPARVLWATKTATWAGAFPDVNGEVFPPGLPPIASPDDALVLDLDGATLERKVRALEAHASQTTGLIGMLGRERYAAWVQEEVFTVADRGAADDLGRERRGRSHVR